MNGQLDDSVKYYYWWCVGLCIVCMLSEFVCFVIFITVVRRGDTCFINCEKFIFL